MLAVGLLARRPGLLSVAVAGLGLEYAAALLVGADGLLGMLAPVEGAALLVVAELAYWSVGPTTRRAARAGVGARKLAGVATLALVSLAVDGVLFAASTAHLGGGLVLLAAGFAGAAATLSTVALLGRRARRGSAAA